MLVLSPVMRRIPEIMVCRIHFGPAVLVRRWFRDSTETSFRAHRGLIARFQSARRKADFVCGFAVSSFRSFGCMS